MIDIDLKLMGIISLLYPDRQIEFHMKYDIGIITEMKMKFNIDLSIAEIIEYIKQGYLLNVTPQDESKTGMIALSEKATQIVSNGTLMKIWTSIPHEMRIAFLEGNKSKSNLEIFGFNDTKPASEKILHFIYKDNKWCNESMGGQPYTFKSPNPVMSMPISVKTNMDVVVKINGKRIGMSASCKWKGKRNWQDTMMYANISDTITEIEQIGYFDEISDIWLYVPLSERIMEITSSDRVKSKIRMISNEVCNKIKDEVIDTHIIERQMGEKKYTTTLNITLQRLAKDDTYKSIIESIKRMDIKMTQTKLAKVSIRTHNPEISAGERCFIGFDKDKCMTYAKTDMNAKTYGHFDIKNGDENIRVSLHIWGVSYKINSVASITLPIEPILDIVDRMDEFKLKKDSMQGSTKRETWIGSYRRYVKVKNDGNGNLVFINNKVGEFHISWHDIIPKLIQTLNKAVNKEVKIVNQQLEYKVKYNRFMDKWKRYTDFKLPDEVKQEETSDDIYKKYYGNAPQEKAQEN